MAGSGLAGPEPLLETNARLGQQTALTGNLFLDVNIRPSGFALYEDANLRKSKASMASCYDPPVGDSASFRG